jgi:16S rRNA (adenine1518-N6/adenine1519-N6)-dimethyltransferase
MTETLLTQTKKLLRSFDLKARKRLGQRFLVDGSVLRRILSAAEITPQDVIVEVGSGLGIMTAELAKLAGWVVAVELDDNLAAMLKQNLASFSNVTVINKDILKIDPASLLKEPGIPTPRYKVVANLPYYITSPTLRHFLEAAVKPERMIVMVQKEVARQIVAKPGDRSVMSIAVQFYGKPGIVDYVPARAFYPAPRVDSAILRIDVHLQPPVPVTDEKSFFEVVRAGFTQPRKQIANSLAQGSGLSKAEVRTRLEKAGVAPERRAETLTLEEWAKLWQVFQERKT